MGGWRLDWPALGLALNLTLTLALPGGIAAADPPAESPRKADFRVEKLAGQVVWLAEVQRVERGIQSVPEAAERVLALKTDDGQLVPLVEDIEAERSDATLDCQGVPLELTVRRYPDTPFVQVIEVVGFDGKQRVQIDYWCEICAIAMYELKDCECCQGPIELRKRPVK